MKLDSETKAQILKQAADCFGVAASQLSPLAGGNFAQVYEWMTDDKGYVLKISPVERDGDLYAMRSMLEWLAYLSTHDVPVVHPLHSPLGTLIESIQYAGRTYLVSASEKIPGVRAEILPFEFWDAGRFQQLGRVIGRCHRVALDYHPDHKLKRLEWDTAINCFNPADDLRTAEGFVIEQRSKVLEVIQSLPKDRVNYGLSHLDIHFANFMVDPATGSIALIDFDDCAYGWYIMDVAMLLFDVVVVYANQRAALSTTFLDALLKGYREEKELDNFWVAQLPAFLKLLEIGVYAMLADYYDPDTSQDQWVNTFMADRERRIRDDVPYLD